MFDFRFHLISLTAIFLALGLGIVIGVAIVDGEALEREQKYLIDRLEEDFRFLREQNSRTKKEIAEHQKKIELWQDFSRETLPFIIEGKLSGKRLAVIRTSDKELPIGLLENLLNAGAEVISQADIDFLFQNENKILRKQSKMFQNKDFFQKLSLHAGLLAEQIYAGDFKSVEAVEGQVLTEEFFDPPDAVILIGGTDYQERFLVDQFDLPLIAHLRDYGMVVAGTEMSGTSYSYIPKYLKKADIIIDEVDTIPGQVALIWALTGFTGYYGTGSGATGLLPKFSNSLN